MRYLRSIALGWTYNTPNYDFTVDLINEFKNKVAKGQATPKVRRNGRSNRNLINTTLGNLGNIWRHYSKKTNANRDERILENTRNQPVYD